MSNEVQEQPTGSVPIVSVHYTEKERHPLERRSDETEEQYINRLPLVLRNLDPETRKQRIFENIRKDKIAKTTRETLMHGWMRNFCLNIPTILKCQDIRELPKIDGKPILIVGGGPSVGKYKQLSITRKYYKKFKRAGGVIIATDKAFIPMLKHRIIPDYVIAADGNPIIAKYFDDPIVDRYARKVTALFNTTVHPNVVKRFKGKKVFYHIIFDDPKQVMDVYCEKCGHINKTTYASLTRIFYYMTHNSLLMSAGNCGTLAWNIAVFLQCKNVCLIGFDYGYTVDTPLEKRSYYNLHMRKYKTHLLIGKHEMGEKVGKEEFKCKLCGVITHDSNDFMQHLQAMHVEAHNFLVNMINTHELKGEEFEWCYDQVRSCYNRYTNPDTKAEYETDFMWDNYKTIFMPWFALATKQFKIDTYNASPTSALFGNGIQSIKFIEWLKQAIK
jgi:hypothetical protein